MTALGRPVDPDVKSTFATVAAFTRAWASSTAPVGSMVSSSIVGVARRFRGGVLVTTSIDAPATSRSAGSNATPSPAKISPGRMVSTSLPSVLWSLTSREYAGAAGAYGTPAYIAASASNACSMLLPDRMRTVRSVESRRSINAWAMRRTRARASP